MTTETKRKFLIDVAFYAVVGALAYFVFKFLSAYLLPFVIGILASFLVQKPVKAINKKTKISKSACTIVLVILTYFAILAVISLLFFLIYLWLSDLTRFLPKLMPTISDTIKTLNASFTRTMDKLPNEFVSYLNGLPDKIIGSVTDGLTSLLSSLAKKAATGTPALLISIIVTVVASCYIAKDYNKIIKLGQEHLPKKAWDVIIDIKILFVKTVFRIMRGYLLLMLITFTELCIGLAIIGQSNFIMLAAIICVVDILPVLGTGTVVLPWALISLMSGHVLKAVGLLIMYLVITVIRNFLEPKVIGEQVGLHPLITLLSIFCGYKLIGFSGIFLFPLTLIVLSDFYARGKISIFRSKGNESDTPAEE